VITLSCPGPAPLWAGDVPGQPLAPRPTGDFVFNAPSSMLFAPAVTVPLLSVGGLPVGIQVMGQPHEDAQMTSLARWLLTSIAPVVAPDPTPPAREDGVDLDPSTRCARPASPASSRPSRPGTPSGFSPVAPVQSATAVARTCPRRARSGAPPPPGSPCRPCR